MNIQSPLDNMPIAVEILKQLDKEVALELSKIPANVLIQKIYKQSRQLAWLKKKRGEYKTAVLNHKSFEGRNYYEVRIAVINEMIKVV